jgi:osmoprotectant transport system permease protein
MRSSSRAAIVAGALTLIFVAGTLAQTTDAGAGTSAPRSPVVVASKPFGESFLLCEMFAQLLEASGIPVERRPGLGATEVAFAAIRSGAIDVYPEYTGTALLAILHEEPNGEQRADPRAVFGIVSQAFADRWGIRWLPPLGFQNTFAIAVRPDTASRDGLHTLSDLARTGGELRAGFTPDFISRADGLPGLVRTYGLQLRDVRPLSTAVKYQALATGAVDVIDGFSTDGLLARYGLVTLADDRHFFPPYEAAAMVSARLVRERPEAIAALTAMSGRLDETRMRALNRRVEVDGEDVRDVARTALAALGLGTAHPAGTTAGSPRARNGLAAYLWQRRSIIGALALRHLALVAIALGAAVIVAVPLGLVLERGRRIAEPVIGGLGVLQTIPSLAMLAFMIPLLGVGTKPALVALWLYALYPIARNTYVGVRDADPAAVEAAEALGTTPAQRLMLVRRPQAAPVLLSGVRTAAVITVGAATLAALVGAGGLGEPIATGLALADTPLILSGALPAAALALIVDALLAIVERAVTPPHLQRRARTA